MYINFWYIAAQSGDVKFASDRPLKVMMLGHHFALWRDSKGKVQCISDTCTHRGGSMADGRVRGDCVECPYHGWTFNGAGACVRLPSLGPDGKIPDRTRIDAYPVEEKYGLVWVFLGDLPEAERPPIIDIPEYGDPQWRTIILSADWNIDYKRSIENTIDPAHNEFTHPTHGFLGVRDDYHVKDFKVEDTQWGSGFRNKMFAPTLAQRDMNEVSGRTGGAWIDGGVGHHGPHCTWVQIHASEKMKLHNYLLHTPIHETLDRWYLIAARNNLLDSRYDSTFADRSAFIAGQDQYVLDPVRPKITPRNNTHEFLVPADKAIARYREYCREWEQRGWRIDVQKFRADYERVAYAIPSPARREHKGWVLPAVPVLAPGAAESTAQQA
ncbi:MAG: Rieske 2Fe-2S domain-containing protein [Gammaproteobacteria bacterium]|nr:Rieske 2Fe-2S domain-containing protein [Gammaproteobacteria bacterium]